MNRIYHWVRHYMLKRKAKLVMRVTHRKDGRLLDIGTGTGYFADTMKRLGWQVEAVEKNASAREFAKAHFGLEVQPETALKDYAQTFLDKQYNIVNKDYYNFFITISNTMYDMIAQENDPDVKPVLRRTAPGEAEQVINVEQN